MRVIVSCADVAPKSDRWIAVGTDYDGPASKLGAGATPLAAIADLLWALSIEDIGPEQVEICWE